LHFCVNVKPQFRIFPRSATKETFTLRFSVTCVLFTRQKSVTIILGKRGFLPALLKLACPTAIALVVLALSLQAQQQPSADPAVIFHQGQQALADGNLDSAESSFHRVLKIDPRSAAAHANLGVVAMRRKDWEQALAELHKAEKLDPRMAGVRLNIGLVEYHRANYPAAIAPLQSAVEAQPDSLQARYLLGLCLMFVGRYADSVNTLEPLWPRMSDQFVYLYILSNAAFHSKNDALDQKALERLVEIGGDSPEFHLVMAKAMLNRHNTERALDELRWSEAGNPGLPFLYFNMGLAYQQANQTDLAEKAFRKDLQAEPDSPYSYEQLGKLYLRADREADAKEAFEQALKRESRLPDTLVELAKIDMHSGQLDTSLHHIDSALKLSPDERSFHYLRGQILQKMGRKTDAEAAFVRARDLAATAVERERANFPKDQIPDPQLATQP
jgi:tetratricopeptide (TPR) repeat protein